MQTNRVIVGVDVAKHVFQLYWVDVETGEEMNLRLTRAKFLSHFANHVLCLVAMEACGSSQHWARHLQELGHEERWPPFFEQLDSEFKVMFKFPGPLL